MEKLVCISCGASDFNESFGRRMVCTYCGTTFIAEQKQQIITGLSRASTATSAASFFAYSASGVYPYAPDLGESNYNPDGGIGYLPVAITSTESEHKKKGLFGRLLG